MAVARGQQRDPHRGGAVDIQDGAVLHADPDAFLTVGDDASIGHAAVVHGCTLEDEVLVGIGAVVLNRARVGRGSLHRGARAGDRGHGGAARLASGAGGAGRGAAAAEGHAGAHPRAPPRATCACEELYRARDGA